MSVRSLTLRLREERFEALRRSSNPSPLDSVQTVEVEEPVISSSAVFKGAREEQVDETLNIAEIPKNAGLKPRPETPSENIPGGIANRFRLKSQRMSEIDRSIDAYTSQVTASIHEQDEDVEDRESDSAPITIELQSH